MNKHYVLAWISIVFFIFSAIYALSFTGVEAEDLVQQVGMLQEKPVFSEDEYGNVEDMLLSIDRADTKLRVANAWLTDEVMALELGVPITYYILKDEGLLSFLNMGYSTVYGLEQGGRMLISKDEVIKQAQGLFYYLIAGLLFVVSFFMIYIMHFRKKPTA